MSSSPSVSLFVSGGTAVVLGVEEDGSFGAAGGSSAMVSTIYSLFVNVRCCFLSSFFVNKKSHGLTAYHLYDMPVLYL